MVRPAPHTPGTFDAVGCAAMLTRIRADDGTTVCAPTLDRSVDEAVAGAIPITHDDRFLVTEALLAADRARADRIIRQSPG